MKDQKIKYDEAYYSYHDGLHFRLGNFYLWMSYYNTPHYVTAKIKGLYPFM